MRDPCRDLGLRFVIHEISAKLRARIGKIVAPRSINLSFVGVMEAATMCSPH